MELVLNITQLTSCVCWPNNKFEDKTQNAIIPLLHIEFKVNAIETWLVD